MEILRVVGGRRLEGETRLSAAKNSVLPIMAASLLADGPVMLMDVPVMTDIDRMGQILRALGCTVVRSERTLMIDPRSASGAVLDGELPTQLRSSIFLLGPLLARCGKAEAVYPGGCAIGKRPIDLHLNGLKQLGAKVEEQAQRVVIDGYCMCSGNISLRYPSVGATENLMMAAVKLRGITKIYNATREPEIVDLAAFLNAMGARIIGAGSGCIEIVGVTKLQGTVYCPIPDRIVGGTLLTAAAITGGRLRLRNICPEHMASVLAALRHMGAEIETDGEGIVLRAERGLRGVRLRTSPFPGLPTDMQAPMMALACAAEGESVVEEDVFENRFQHVGQLRKMGADIVLSGRCAFIQGARLCGTSVEAGDLRCGAALVIAAMAAEGVSEVGGVSLIDRGYERLEEQLSALGAQVLRVSDR